MGLLEEVAGPLSQQFSKLGTASQVGVVALTVIVLSVVLNVLNQLMFKNPNEPPMVFHWLPLIGSTVTYGMDPPRFFKENSQKVSQSPPPQPYRVSFHPADLDTHTAWRCFHLHPPRQEDHRIRRPPGQRVYLERKAKGRQCGGDLQQPDRSCLWQGRRLRLPQCQAHGAEEGASTVHGASGVEMGSANSDT